MTGELRIAELPPIAETSRLLVCRWLLEPNAALAFDACLFDGVHLTVSRRDTFRLLLIAAVRYLRPKEHDS